MKKRFALCSLLVLTALPTLSPAQTLAKVKAGGFITMGVRDASVPLSYQGGDMTPVGFQVDLCRRIISEIQTQQGMPKLEVRYQSVTSANRVPLVSNGTVDIECGSTTNNKLRAQDVAFSLTTYLEEDRMAVRADSSIKSIRDLGGKSVSAVTGSTTVQHLRQHERASGLDVHEIYAKDHADSFLLLESGRVDAWLNDQAILHGLIASSKNPAGFKVVGEVLNREPIALMFRKDDPEFKKLVDDVIRKMDANGEMKALWARWFQSPIPPRNTNLNMEPPEALQRLWAQPNDLPMETYATK
jgi:glutamate/aspartate transport system substrate-binding protein